MNSGVTCAVESVRSDRAGIAIWVASLRGGYSYFERTMTRAFPVPPDHGLIGLVIRYQTLV
jgi:hypothetical protein